jgi:hypothetical protein
MHDIGTIILGGSGQPLAGLVHIVPGLIHPFEFAIQKYLLNVR